LRAALALKDEAQSDDQVEALYEETREQERVRQEVAEKETRSARERARFFNKPNAVADFDYWAQAAFWSADEATALSFGKEPDVVNLRSLRKVPDESAFAFKYRRRFKLIRRASQAGGCGIEGRVDPNRLLCWLRNLDLNYPSDFEVKLQSRKSSGARAAPAEIPEQSADRTSPETTPLLASGKATPSGLLTRIASALATKAKQDGYVLYRDALSSLVRDVLAVEGFYLSKRQFTIGLWSKLGQKIASKPGGRSAEIESKFRAAEPVLRSLVQQEARRWRADVR
jgi:hypothetical protein